MGVFPRQIFFKARIASAKNCFIIALVFLIEAIVSLSVAQTAEAKIQILKEAPDTIFPICRLSVGPASCEFKYQDSHNEKYAEYLAVECKRPLYYLDSQKTIRIHNLVSRWRRGLRTRDSDIIGAQSIRSIEVSLLGEPQLIRRAMESLKKQTQTWPKCTLQIELKPPHVEN